MDALRLASSETVDAAILDINLQGELVYPAADMLMERNIPVFFANGYDRREVPERFKTMLRFGKPFDPGKLVEIVIRNFEQPAVAAPPLNEHVDNRAPQLLDPLHAFSESVSGR